MRLLVPYLFPPAQTWQTATAGLRLPALETLLARGRRSSCPAAGIEAAVCDILGIARQQDYPIAPIALEADAGHAGRDYWLRADPVHLAVMRDRIVLAGSDALELSQAEADALTAGMREHFGDAFTPRPVHPQRWYLRCPTPPDLVTTPLALAAGLDVRPLQPQGRDALRLRALLNEAQMLFHAHPVNQAREADGRLPVNSLWLWGGGTLPARPDSPPLLYAARPEIQTLAAFAHGRCLPVPDAWHLELASATLILDSLSAAGTSGDTLSRRQALHAFENNWSRPMLRALQAGGLRQLTLEDPIHGRMLNLRRADTWKLWRRARPLQDLD